MQCGKEFNVESYKKKKGRGKYCSRECSNKAKVGVSINSGPPKGSVPWNKGLTGLKSSWNKGLKGYKSGDKHYNWKGGKTKLNKAIRGSSEYKLWRSSVFERDKYTCLCGKSGCYLEANHIEPLSEIIKKFKIETLEDASRCEALWDINNGETLCINCHMERDSYRRRFKKAAPANKRRKKCGIYTSIVGGKDEPRADIKCFTDYSEFKNETRNAKIYKVLSHFYIKEEYSLWVDGNIHLKISEKELIELMGDKDILTFANPYRTNIYDEAEECKRLKLDHSETIDQQMTRYTNTEVLSQCGVILRRHTEEIKRLNEKWWAEICAGSVRDQLSFNAVFKDVKILELGNPFNNKYFKKLNHKIPR